MSNTKQQFLEGKSIDGLLNSFADLGVSLDELIAKKVLAKMP